VPAQVSSFPSYEEIASFQDCRFAACAIAACAHNDISADGSDRETVYELTVCFQFCKEGGKYLVQI
jgi:hypothetical protein